MLRQWKRWETGRVKPQQYASLIASMFGTVTVALFDDDDRHRLPIRSVSDTGPVAATGMNTLELVNRLRSSDVSQATLQTLRFRADQLCCEYPYMDPEQLKAEGREWLARLDAVRDSRLTLAQHREVLDIAGWLSLLVGCLEYDTADIRASEATRTAALQIGTETGDAEIAAWAHEMKAWRALTQGNYEETVAAARAGRQATSRHSVAVQLSAQEAKAWARMGDRRNVEIALEEGRKLMEALPYPENPQHHFVVDPDKFDFYAMDCYRTVGEDALAEMHAREVIRRSTAPDGTERLPMRIAEARVTLGVVAARSGDLAGASEAGTAALHSDRVSLPSLLLIANELGHEMAAVAVDAPETRQYREQVQALRKTA